MPSSPAADSPPFADCSGLTAPPLGAAAVPSPVPDGSPWAQNLPGGTPQVPPSVPGDAPAVAPTVPDGGPIDGPAATTGSTATTLGVLPEIELACFTGGQPVPLQAVRGPAVINLWASWCPPCRKELPAFQRLAGQAGEKLHVIGVVTRDDRQRARSVAEGLGLTFPNLFDPEEDLGRALGRRFVPMTLFVDNRGQLRHLDASGALDDAALARLTGRHLGVVVSA